MRRLSAAARRAVSRRYTAQRPPARRQRGPAGFRPGLAELWQLLGASRRRAGVVDEHQFLLDPLSQRLRLTGRRRPWKGDTRLARSRTRGCERGRRAGLASLSYPARYRRIRDAPERFLPQYDIPMWDPGYTEAFSA